MARVHWGIHWVNSPPYNQTYDINAAIGWTVSATNDTQPAGVPDQFTYAKQTSIV